MNYADDIFEQKKKIQRDRWWNMIEKLERIHMTPETLNENKPPSHEEITRDTPVPCRQSSKNYNTKSASRKRVPLIRVDAVEPPRPLSNDINKIVSSQTMVEPPQVIASTKKTASKRKRTSKSKKQIHKFACKESKPKRTTTYESKLISKGVFSRMARDMNLNSLSNEAYGVLRNMVQYSLKQIVQRLIVIAEHSKRKTITHEDVRYVLHKRAYC